VCVRRRRSYDYVCTVSLQSQHHTAGGGAGGPSTSSSTSATPQPSSSSRISNQDVFARLCEMGEEPDRAQFLEALFGLLQERGNPITAVPSISKTAIDLYRLYHLTKERGGAQEVRMTTTHQLLQGSSGWCGIWSYIQCGNYSRTSTRFSHGFMCGIWSYVWVCG
jgi:hypothetical protein